VKIQSTSGYTSLLFQNISSQQRQTSASPAASSAASAAIHTDKATISQAARDRAAEETKRSGTYDFTNMTPQQMQQAMNDLIRLGKLSLDDSSQLIGLIPTALAKVQYDGQPPAAYYQPTNFLASLALGIEGEKSRNDTENVERITKALNALERLQGTKIE
jgi:hypothetical protein